MTKKKRKRKRDICVLHDLVYLIALHYTWMVTEGVVLLMVQALLFNGNFSHNLIIEMNDQFDKESRYVKFIIL